MLSLTKRIAPSTSSGTSFDYAASRLLRMTRGERTVMLSSAKRVSKQLPEQREGSVCVMLSLSKHGAELGEAHRSLDKLGNVLRLRGFAAAQDDTGERGFAAAQDDMRAE